MTCECKVCERHKQLRALAEAVPSAKAFLEELDTQLEAAETDAVYWRMKYEGTWPTHDILPRS